MLKEGKDRWLEKEGGLGAKKESHFCQLGERAAKGTRGKMAGKKGGLGAKSFPAYTVVKLKPKLPSKKDLV